MNLSDILTSLNYSKSNILDKDPSVEKEYTPYIINRCLSYFKDTIFYANKLNNLPLLDKKLQYDYYLYSLTKRKRFSKWIKEEKNKDIETIQEYYGYSYKRAKETIASLTIQQIEEMRKLLQKGGSKTPKQ